VVKDHWAGEEGRISRQLQGTTSGAVGGKRFTAAVVVVTIDFNIQALVVCDPKGRINTAVVAVERSQPVALANCFDTVAYNCVPHDATAPAIADIELRFMCRNIPVCVPCTPDRA
jgi:hypothetical protein